MIDRLLQEVADELELDVRDVKHYYRHHIRSMRGWLQEDVPQDVYIEGLGYFCLKPTTLWLFAEIQEMKGTKHTLERAERYRKLYFDKVKLNYIKDGRDTKSKQ